MSLKALFESAGTLAPSVRPDEVEKYEAYLALLTEWNERMSLVSPKSLLTAFGTHFVDSLRICDAADPFEKEPLFDIGSGAGFPGLIHAIRFPDRPIRLFERTQKKQRFLAEAITALQLNNVELDGAFPEQHRHRGVFFARAVFPPEKFFPFFRKTLHPRSVIVANLGGQGVSEGPPPDFAVEVESQYTLPQDCGSRRVQILRFVPRGTKNR